MSAAGNRLLERSRLRALSSCSSFILNEAGEFEELAERGLLAHTNGERSIWLKENPSGFDVWHAESATDEGTLLASVETKGAASAVSVANGALGVLAYARGELLGVL